MLMAGALVVACVEQKKEVAPDAGTDGSAGTEGGVEGGADVGESVEAATPIVEYVTEAGYQGGGWVDAGGESVYDPDYHSSLGHLVDVDGGWETAQACTSHLECVLVAARCFSYRATVDDLAGINEEWLDHYVAPMCGGRFPASVTADLIPLCVEDRCQAVAVSEQDVSRCETAEDCRLRTRTCCECDGDPSYDKVIAITRGAETDYERLVCDSDQPDCEPCELDYPPTEVQCGEVAEISCDGHCKVYAAVYSCQ
jgi:hypothetical protein